MANLDLLAARRAHEMTDVIGKRCKGGQVNANDADNLFTKALGVFQENGVYAGMLFLLSRSGEGTQPEGLKAEEMSACYAVAQLLELLREIEDLDLEMSIAIPWNEVNLVDRRGQRNTKRDILNHVANTVCARSMDQLLLVKSLCEQTLIYARYGAKAQATAEGSMSQ
jgi:hypothetical protein